MAAKLLSIVKLIPWSLAARAAAFGLAWLLVPRWVFFLVALMLYFVPLFRSLRFLFPFLILLFFAAVEVPGGWLAFFLTSSFFLLLGVKDLVFIRRRAAHEIFLFLLLFLVAFRYFARFETWGEWAALPAALLIGFVFFLLLRGFLREDEEGNGAAGAMREVRRRNLLAAGAGALFTAESALGILFLPASSFVQSSLLFCVCAMLLTFLPEWARGTLGRGKILAGLSAFFAVAVLILAAV